MVKYSNIEPIEQQLKFGVELTDLYPPWYLHPSLKNLVYLATNSVQTYNKRKCNLAEIISRESNCQGTVQERMQLKQAVIHYENIFDLDLSPGVPLWLIRHFLGLLPSPIFPSQNNPFHWINLSIKCHKSASKEIKNTVARELACLPARNLTFLFELFELLRTLATDKMVDKNAALNLVKYFAASLFVRPYRSGIAENNDNAYYSLLLFIIYFWPTLRLKIHDIILARDKHINTFYYFRDKYSEDYYADTSRYLTDKNVQTENPADVTTPLNVSDHFEQFDTSMSDRQKQIGSDTSLVDGESKMRKTKNVQDNPKLITSTPFKQDKTLLPDNVNLNTFDEMIASIKTYLTSMYGNLEINIPKLGMPQQPVPENTPNTSIHTQTDRPMEKREKSTSSTKFKIRSTSLRRRKGAKDSQIVVKFQVECCHRRRLIRKQRKPVRIVSGVKSNDMGQSKDDLRFLNESVSAEKISPVVSHMELKGNTPVHNEDGFIFDSFIGKCYNSSKFNENSSFNLDLFGSCDKSGAANSDVYSRIKKFGWTYSRGSDVESAPIVQVTTDGGYGEIEPYKLCYDTNVCGQDSCHSLDARRVSVMDGLKKVTSKLSFLRNLTPNKLLFGRSISNENIFSTIKYKRLPKSACSI